MGGEKRRWKVWVFQPHVPAQSDSDQTKCFSTRCPFTSATEGDFVNSGSTDCTDADGYLTPRPCKPLRRRKKKSLCTCHMYPSHVTAISVCGLGLSGGGLHARHGSSALDDKLI